MRIAITHPYSWPEVRRGAERIIMETGRALAARGHEITVLTSGGRASRRREDGMRIIRYRRIFVEPYRHQHWFGWRVLPALVAGRYDVVHSMAPWDAVSSIRSARITGHRTVYEELGIPERVKIEQRADREACERVIRHIDVFGCMSEFTREHLNQDWGREGVIIPGGVRMSEFQPRPRHPRPTILFSGAMDRPGKGVRQLLEAVAVLAERRPEVQLHLTGPGDPAPLLAEAPPAAQARTSVRPLGAPRELASEYAAAWTTCLPTLTDSFGLVVIESLASGTPVVAGPAGAPREVVKPSIGAVASALDPEPLADALDHSLGLVEDSSTVDRCRAVAARYDWDDAIAPLLEAIYIDTRRH